MKLILGTLSRYHSRCPQVELLVLPRGFCFQQLNLVPIRSSDICNVNTVLLRQLISRPINVTSISAV